MQNSPMRAFRQLLVGVTIAATLPCQSAWAQQSAVSVTAAEALFEQGREAMTAGDFDTACTRFRESNRLDPAVGTRLNLADCEERRGKLAQAWSLFRGAVAELDPSDDRVTVVKQRIRTLESRVPKLMLTRAKGAPANLNASLGGADFGPGSFGVPLPMDPGRYEIIVSAPGYAMRTIVVELAEGETADIKLSPGESLTPPPQAAEEPAQERPASSSGSDRRTWTYVLGGIGLAGLGLGAAAGVVTLHEKSVADSNCRDDLQLCNAEGARANDTGKTYAMLSTIGFIVGGVGVGGAAILLLSEPDEPESAVRAEITPNSATLGYARSF